MVTTVDLREIEFFSSPGGEVMVQEPDSPLREFKETDRYIIEVMIIIIKDMYPIAYKALEELYDPSKPNRLHFQYKIVHRFIRCNFGEYDLYHHDIDLLGNLRFEEVKCPLRKECVYEKIICKPKLSTNLTARELEIFKLIGRGWQASDIAGALIISTATVNRHRENIKTKLNLRTIGEMVNYFNTYLKHE